MPTQQLYNMLLVIVFALILGFHRGGAFAAFIITAVAVMTNNAIRHGTHLPPLLQDCYFGFYV